MFDQIEPSLKLFHQIYKKEKNIFFSFYTNIVLPSTLNFLIFSSLTFKTLNWLQLCVMATNTLTKREESEDVGSLWLVLHKTTYMCDICTYITRHVLQMYHTYGFVCLLYCFVVFCSSVLHYCSCLHQFPKGFALDIQGDMKWNKIAPWLFCDLVGHCIHSHICCICLTFLHCVSWNVSPKVT